MWDPLPVTCETLQGLAHPGGFPSGPWKISGADGDGHRVLLEQVVRNVKHKEPHCHTTARDLVKYLSLCCPIEDGTQEEVMLEDGLRERGVVCVGNCRALPPRSVASAFFCELPAAFPLTTRAGDKKIKSISVTQLLARSGGDVYYERLCEKGLTIYTLKTTRYKASGKTSFLTWKSTELFVNIREGGHCQGGWLYLSVPVTGLCPGSFLTCPRRQTSVSAAYLAEVTVVFPCPTPGQQRPPRGRALVRCRRCPRHGQSSLPLPVGRRWTWAAASSILHLQ